MLKRLSSLSAILLLAGALGSGQERQERSGPRFYSDDPIARVLDTQDASKVQARELSLTYDALTNLFGKPGRQTVERAASVNTIDEVPDSSWFTNRLGTRTLTADELLRGPNDDRGPAPGTWRVSRKAGGASAGFTIVDSRGRRYFVKLDPPGYPELGSASEVIVTRVFHAAGYNVPQASLATFRREDLVIAPDATVRLPGGGQRKMR